MKVLVTGGAGFIGANLCRTLVDSGNEVVALDDLSSGRKENLRGVDAELVEGTILDRAVLDSAIRGAGAVVHLAARPSVPRSIEDPVATHRVNATGTVEVLEAVRRVSGHQASTPHIVVASSSSVYGVNPTLPKREELATLPMSPYGASKLATEAYALAYQHSFGMPVLAFRFFNVFGPFQAADHAYAAVVPAFIAAALAGDPIVVQGDGHQTRDFTDVGTVAALITDAVARHVTSPAPVNLAFGTRTEILELARMVEQLVGHPIEISHTAARVGDVRHSQNDPTRLRELFPEIVAADLYDALGDTLEWFRNAA